MKSLAVAILLLAGATSAGAQTGRWSEAQAADWYRRQPWLVGANYIPANAINQLEMWQKETFSPGVIDKELGWAADIGMNTMRVFLHDLLWQQDPEGFRQRIDQFLEIARKHGIKPMLVLFDSCWDVEPRLGPQRAPRPGIHNSGWVQGPGAKALQDPAQYPRLEAYVKGVVGAFANDERILAWDIWNEPDNPNQNSYDKHELPNKVELVTGLLSRAFEWARSANPRQPLTSGVWRGEWATDQTLKPIEKVQLESSDVISFHNYTTADTFESNVKALSRYNRPILCTEYLARSRNNTFETILPLAKKYNVAAYNWGLVVGKTQTHLPWDSWQKPYVNREPPVWHHEVFRANGEPYRVREVNLIRRLTGRGRQPARKVA